MWRRLKKFGAIELKTSTYLLPDGALATIWTTFVPCFLCSFLGGPHIEQLRGNEGLTTALSAVTAAVVGGVLNLAVWFGLHIVFQAANAVDWFTVVVLSA